MKNFFNHQFFPILLRHLAAVVTIIFTTWLLKPLEPLLAKQLIALLFLLPVMLSTVLWGMTPGVLAGVLAFLFFNYFFIPPYFTFAVHQTQDVITLIVFLIVVVVMSNLIGRAREGMQLARRREWEATRMYELISALSGMQDAKQIALELASHTQETFHFNRVNVEIRAQKDQIAISIIFPPGKALPVESPQKYPIRTARGLEGEVMCWRSEDRLDAEEKRLLEAFTSQAALALERVRLVQSEYRTQILEESDRLKSSLLNSVSHELRSPLAAIKASVSSLRNNSIEWPSEARQDLLATIEEETDQLNLLVGNLLDMSRIESGALKPQKSWNSISEIAMSMIAKMRKQLENYQLHIDFPSDLPLIATDYILISQVFSNLLSNSIKYAPAHTHIDLQACIENNLIHVQVKNESPAVPEQYLERIFDKFYRFTAADQITGTGLGLSICKGIIESHGGQIWVENQPERFVFHFTLPLDFNGILPQYPQVTSDE